MGIEAAIITSAALSAGAGVAGAAMAGGGGSSRRKLPPELEIQMFKKAQSSLAQIDQEIARTRTLEKALNTRLATAERLVKATTPSPKDLAMLRQTGVDIVKAMGGNALEAARSGFIDEESARELAALQRLEDPTFKTPAMEAEESKIADERAAFEQTLVGLSPDAKGRALAQFDREAQQFLGTRRDEIVRSTFERGVGRLSAREAVRAARFGETVTGLEATTGALQFGRTGAAQIADLGFGRFRAGLMGQEARSGLRGEAQGLFESMGEFDISKRGQQAVESGLVGPGSMYTQTGVPRSRMGEYKNEVAQAEWEASKKRFGGYGYL